MTKTLTICSLLVLLIPYIEVTNIWKSYCLHCSTLTGKVLKAVASLVLTVVTSVRIIWFLKTCFLYRVTGKKYFVKGELHCNFCNVIYLEECSNCKHQYIGSVLNFKQRFRIHKSDIKTNKDCCGTARHFNNVCCHPSNSHIIWKFNS